MQARLVLAEGCVQGIADSLQGTLATCHEGVVYLFGRTDGETTVALTAFRPEAHTTPGSFEVRAVPMARVVRAANELSLHIVGQVHTHPTGAAHSNGDVTGARMKYPGYISIVLPEYGKLMPALDGAAVYSFSAERHFVLLDHDAVLIAPGKLE